MSSKLQWAVPWHLKIEPRTGQLIEDYDVNITNDGQNYSDGKLVGKGFYEIKFNKVEARYIRLVMKSEVNGMSWSSAAEINLGDENGENIDRSNGELTTLTAMNRSLA